MKKQMISILLIFCMVVGLLPTTAFASDDAAKAIQLGASGISGYDSTNGSYDYIHFGTWGTWNDNPIKWRVLDTKTNTSDAQKGDGFFLLSDALLGTGEHGGVEFDYMNTNNWQGSRAQDWCKDFYTRNLSTAEQNAVLATSKSDALHGMYYAASDNILNGDKVFFLSAEEAENAAYGFTDDNARIANYGDSAHGWWLRSPSRIYPDSAGVVRATGVVSANWVKDIDAARPAFNLDPNAVLLVSAAAGGKSADGISKIPEYNGDEWKLTLLDDTRTFKVTETAAVGKPGGTVTLNFSGPRTGQNEYISVIIEGKSGVTHYGRIMKPVAADTQLSFTIPYGLDSGNYKLYVFSEQCNGDYRTDYASRFQEVALTVEEAADEQFTLIPGGTYYFDLSGAGIPGTVNDALPDRTLHYVPFTYAGTVDAYKLTKEMATTEAYAQQTEYAHSLFIADYVVTHTVKWNTLNDARLIFGKGYTADGVDYMLRAPSAGSASIGLERGTPQSNEWDRILDKDDGYIKNWKWMYSQGQDTSEAFPSSRSVRGSGSNRSWRDGSAEASVSFYGFRPVLEVLNPDTLGSDGLKAVTLDLGGGKLGNSSEDIQIIVKNGKSFTAPISEGLTRPDGGAGSYFMWLGSDGKFYNPGDSVPTDVTRLTAQFAPIEYFNLAPGGTYYFDLSGENIPGADPFGTVNDALPDTSLHYVPFTYAGIVDAYTLTSEMATTEEYAQQNKSAHSLFIADYAVMSGVYWHSLKIAGLIFGKGYAAGGVDYTLRAPSVGSDGTGSGDSQRGTPQSNEWDRILDKNSGYIKNWSAIYSWGQDTPGKIPSDRAVRGYGSTRDWNSYNAATSHLSLGFRPALEVLNPGTLGPDGLKAVTLDLGSGKLGGSSDDIQIIVKNGGSFTAPASDGLTRPDGDTGSYFMWRGSDGKLYASGDSVPADVDKLTAQFDYIEQFALTLGGTYWFDLSGAAISGTVNGSLPDTTLHYVPFTYAGTVDAYKLISEMATTDEYAEENAYRHSLFVADYAVTHTVSWDELNAAGLIFGKDYAAGSVDYTLRAPSAGRSFAGSGDSVRGNPQSNEWDKILDKYDGYIKNYSNMSSWGQDTASASAPHRALRGYSSVRNWSFTAAEQSRSSNGFRPVLEVLNPGTPGSDGLKAVTLDLGGGKLGGSSAAIQIVVKNGESFTAPVFNGLARPDGDTGSYFMWLGSDGKLYDPGDSVPADVIKLTAQFAPSTVTITITTESLPDGKVSEAYHHTLTADDTAPITWSIDEGRLPAGLSLNSTTGEISGAPIAEGTVSFTVKAASSAGSGTKELRITIAAADPVKPVSYLDADGKRQLCTEYTVLKSNTANSILDLENKWYELPAGWYVVEGDVIITPRVDTQGEVNLILKDGCHFMAEWGINVKKGDTFTVYAQSTGEDTMGKLTACLPEDFNSDWSVDYVVWPHAGLSGIGGGVRWKGANNGIYESEGTIVINGGNIRAKGQDRASAIGGTFSDYAGVDRGGFFSEKRLGGSITINGGIVRTEAITRGNAITAFSVGIGSCCSGYGGSVTINGGTVVANAANSAISTGWDGSITINGGTVTATGGINNFAVEKDALILGNGIGPYWNGTVTVNGGKIKASTEGQGSGIGGSRSKTEVIINGGEIEAAADQYGTGQYGGGTISAAGIGGVGSVSITGGRISATGNGGAAGIGGDAEVSITGGEITVSATGTGAAIGGTTGEDCGSIHIQGDVLKSVSSVNGACIGAANGKGSGNITIADAKLPPLSGKYILIGWDVDSPGGTLTIRNSRVASTDIPTRRTDGIRVGSNSEIVIEESEIRLPHYRSIRAGGDGSIAIRDSDLRTYGIFMDETVHTITDAKTLKKLEITDSTVVTGDIIGARGDCSSVEEIVIRNSNISLDSTDPYNSYFIGCGSNGSFGSIDIQNSTIDIPWTTSSAAIGSAMGGSFTGESLIRIVDSQVTAASLRGSPAIGAGVSSYGKGKLKICIENSDVTAKGGSLKTDDFYIPGIGKHGSDGKPEVYIQILNSTVESFRHTKTGVEDDSDLVYDDLHKKDLTGIPTENITICGSTVNGKRIDHSFDEYGKCALCGKYDLAYCYEHGLLTIEGLTGCVSDGSAKTLTGLSHKTGEDVDMPLTEGTDYTAIYSNNVGPYTLTPEDEGFDPAKAPKVTLCGTGKYCGKAEHYFTIGKAERPSYTVTVTNDGSGMASARPSSAVAGTEITLTATPNTGYHFKEWQVVSGGVVIKDNRFTMPDGNVEVKAIFEKNAPPAPTEYTVTFDGNGGTPSVGSMTTTKQKLVSLPSASRSNYSLDGWYTKKSGGTEITTNTLFTGNTTVYAHWTYTGGGSSGNSGFTSYPITVPDKTENGDVTVSLKNASKGSTVTITVTPGNGYVLETISVIDKSGNDLKLTDKGNGKYTFTMPGSKVEVKVSFMEDNSVLNFFYDVPNDAYYYEAVKWAAENGITGGIGNSLFAPNQPCTRAQIVTFLWRAAGSPVVNYLMPFTDVDEGAYYAEAVRWALSEGITTGTEDGTFSPDAACTRAQAVAFLFRAAVANGLEAVTLAGLISGFDDAASVPGYAVPAMNWALSQGIVKGSGTQLLPGGTCTRAQIVTFLYRAYQGN